MDAMVLLVVDAEGEVTLLRLAGGIGRLLLLLSWAGILLLVAMLQSLMRLVEQVVAERIPRPELLLLLLLAMLLLGELKRCSASISSCKQRQIIGNAAYLNKLKRVFLLVVL